MEPLKLSGDASQTNVSSLSLSNAQPPNAELAARFLRLFAGRADQYFAFFGLSKEPPLENHKQKAKAEKTIHEPVTEETWSRHLAGDFSLSIFPAVTPDAEGRAVFGVVDVDVFVDPRVIVSLLEMFEIPALVCRSRSGRAHCFLFAAEPVPVASMWARLEDIKNILVAHVPELEHAKKKEIEIFPFENGGGRAIAMPYYADMAATRYCIRADGSIPTPADFLKLAERTKQAAAWFEQPVRIAQHVAQVLKELETATPVDPANRPTVEQLMRDKLDRFKQGQLAGRKETAFYWACDCHNNGWAREDLKPHAEQFIKQANVIKCGKEQSSEFNYGRLWGIVCSVFRSARRAPFKKSERQSEVDWFLQLLEEDGCEYFHGGPGDLSYVRMLVDGHREVMMVEPRGRSKGQTKVERYMSRRFFATKGKPAKGEAVNDVVDMILARCDVAPKVDIYSRFARSQDAIYLDLCNDQWQAVEVTAEGWKVIDNPPVLFRRANAAQPLPVPTRNAHGPAQLNTLRNLVNAGDDAQWALMLGWLVGVFQPVGSFAHLAIEGERGSAKTTTSRVLQTLLDPSEVGLSAPPKNEEDATLVAMNSGVVAFDNLSGCRAELSDIFCRFSTGQGYQTRTFFTNLELTVISVKAPLLINGISGNVLRGDLLDRCIMLKLPRILPTQRKTERDVWEQFAELHPSCLGALLDAVSIGLRRFDGITLPDVPRMSDFITWVTACEPGLPWEPGYFLTTFRAMQQSAEQDLAESDDVSAAMLACFNSDRRIPPGGECRLSATAMLTELNRDGAPRDARFWPQSASSLALKLVRLAPTLRAAGLEVEQLKRTDHQRLWIIRRLKQGSLFPSEDAA